MHIFLRIKIEPFLIKKIFSGTPDDYHRSHEQRPQDEYIIDYPSAYRHQQQRRLRELSSVSEQSSPSYNNYPTNQIRRQQLPLFSPIHTTPTIARVHPNSPVITPSRYSSMPPSYDELFLQPHTLTNR